jgi:hypothetical protein
MGIHPESSQSLAATGPNISDTNSDNDSDDDDDDCGDMDMDSDSQCEDDADGASSVGNDNDSESVEKEIALSLLDLSSVSRLVSSASSSTTDTDWPLKDQQQKALPFSVNAMLEEQKLPAVDASEAPIDLSLKSKPSTSSSSSREPEAKRFKLEKNGLVRSIGVVGEAQLWEPEEVPNECLNLKKVLNIRNSPVTVSAPVKASSDITLVREIKQEVLEPLCENPVASMNGHISDIGRKRQDSETSNSSVALPPISNERSCTPGSSNAQGPNNSAPVRLHQPWLSPPERGTKDSEKEAESPSPADVKTSGATLESTNNKLYEEAKSKAAAAASASTVDRATEVASPNSKLYTNFANLKPQAEFRQPSGAQALVK